MFSVAEIISDVVTCEIKHWNYFKLFQNDMERRRYLHRSSQTRRMYFTICCQSNETFRRPTSYDHQRHTRQSTQTLVILKYSILFCTDWTNKLQ